MSQDESIRALIEENGQLKLYLASLIRLLLQKGSITKQELTSMITAIDAEDGRPDGKYTGRIT